MALVSIAIVSVFAGGLNVYDRVRKYSDIRTDILFALEKMEKGLKNACNFSEIDFNGEAARITFPAVNTRPGAKDGLPPGSVSYYIDHSANYLVSEERDYSAATAQEPPKGVVAKLASATGVEFSYYSYDPAIKAYGWNDTFIKKKDENKEGADASKLGTREEILKKKKLSVNTPLGVSIRIRYEDRGESHVLSRTVFFPLAVSLHFAQVVSEKKEKEKQEKEGKGKEKGPPKIEEG